MEFSLEVLRRQRIVPDGTEAFPSIGDPDDRPIVGSALAAEAERFVTGDQLLLVLKDLEGMPIVSPRECWERLLLAS
ncbi:PilT protein domain protein [Thioalkalivibrio nitratireducens DSM 14787]|uniref:PilT protein domain protein n=1 Tax=Thioalkalivibrio nitratireducens (strain DSM 14787 / UNIQEM 213 / ALEN2) TaxID=1255043 RepID=L0DVW0_THIND|nr:PilT protein domain protein [Thioalkalivibrio nitratireducens DSM 14787]